MHFIKYIYLFFLQLCCQCVSHYCTLELVYPKSADIDLLKHHTKPKHLPLLKKLTLTLQSCMRLFALMPLILRIREGLYFSYVVNPAIFERRLRIISVIKEHLIHETIVLNCHARSSFTDLLLFMQTER